MVAVMMSAFAFGDHFKHVAEEHAEKIDAYHRSVADVDGDGASSDPSSSTTSSSVTEAELGVGSPPSLEQADADEAEDAEDVENQVLDPEPFLDPSDASNPSELTDTSDASESVADIAPAQAERESASVPAATAALQRCGGQPATMIPFASSSNTGRHHLLRRTLFHDDAAPPSSPHFSLPRPLSQVLDDNGTAPVVDIAAADPAEEQEQQQRQEQHGGTHEGGTLGGNSQHRRLEASASAWSTPPRRRRLLHRSVGFTSGKAGCGKELTVRVEHENDGAGPIVRRVIKPGEEELAACLQRPEKCGGTAASAAGRALPGLASLRKVPKVQLTGLLDKGKKTFKSCAIVGNAGHLTEQEYGRYIDSHEAVVRFNVLPVDGFEKHIGAKTTLRMLNSRRSVALCCRGNFPEGRAGRANVSDTGVMIWFPEAQAEILGACKRRFPANPRFAIPMSVNKAMAEAMRKMRTDATRLGLGPFSQWRQLTSGAHAVLLFSQLCDRVSLYGFTTFGVTKGGPDQYAGRSERARSGTIWHDWGGEKGVWRMMYAAGALDICSA